MRRILHVVFLSLAALLAGAPAAADDGALKRGNDAYAAKEYARAAEAFRAVLAADPANAAAWYRLGVSVQAGGALDDAERDYREALRRGYAEWAVDYRLAGLEAVRKRPALAMDWLEKSNALQAYPPEVLENDPNFAPLRGEPRFAALVDTQRRAFNPCRFDTAYRALDFWIGDWTVQDANGNALGTSSIEAILDRCVIQENWSDARSNHHGKSFSFYDKPTQRWVQHYVSDAAAATDYAGGPQGAALVFAATGTGKDGKPVRIRMTLTPLPDGRVRHLFETSPDGTAWTPGFDGYYTRAKARTSMRGSLGGGHRAAVVAEDSAPGGAGAGRARGDAA
jgi:tetratricopeptide (TPR) repeat protein